MSRLSSYFSNVAVKRLSAVESDPETSNQHEFNGVQNLLSMFGSARISGMPASFFYFGEEEEKSLSADGFLTWYDARENHPTRTEYRLYFPGNEVMNMAAPGDLLLVGRKPDQSCMVIVAAAGSTSERQLLWLFGFAEAENRFLSQEISEGENREIGFAERIILESLGIEPETEETDFLALIMERFGAVFPNTRTFSAFARETLPEVVSSDDPDTALMEWMNREELLFRTLENHIVGERIVRSFTDVDEFVSFSLSVHNRRKSRVGFALENHLEQVLIDHRLRYARGVVTENRAKPDFLFPGKREYDNLSFPATRLTMLGAKSTCKDRWRQVLSEAARINSKHLLTLEPGISINQTDEMQANSLQLVLPEQLHTSYLPAQRTWLMNVSEFINLVKNRESSSQP